METFPEELGCWVADSFSNMSPQPKEFLGNKTFEDRRSEIHAKFVFNNSIDLNTFFLWWVNSVGHGLEQFSTSLPFMSDQGPFPVTSLGDLTPVMIGSTYEIKFTLRLEHSAEYIAAMAPSEITDLTATDAGIATIWIEWGNATGDAKYDLYSGTTLIDSDVKSPYKDIFTGTRDYHVVASNHIGDTPSNVDSGTGLPNVGSIVISKASEFTIPDFVTTIKMCLIGGGGAGALSIFSADVSAGGGNAGENISETISVISGSSHQIIIGNGGLSRIRGTSNYSNDGHGDDSIAFGFTAMGGECGVHKTTLGGATYQGNGGAGADICGQPSTSTDGVKHVITYLSYGDKEAMGGEASDGDGGNGHAAHVEAGTAGTPNTIFQAGNGGTGAGGGAFNSGAANLVTVKSGAGGDGVCKISWDSRW